MRIIIDASVITRMAFFSDEYIKEVIMLVDKEIVTLLTCPEIQADWMAGFCGVYTSISKKSQSIDIRKMIQAAMCLGGYLIKAECVNLGVVGGYSTDPGDNKYIQCAIDGNADYIISQDGDHLLAISNKIPNANGKMIQIVSPFQFLLEQKMRKKGFRVSNYR